MTSLFRPDVEALAGYTPGEQPQETGWVKLNTNENPYPPSPTVVAAIKQAAEGRLNVYPDPLGRKFCQVAAEVYGVDPDWILPANGSDENLTILVRAFADKNDLIAYPYPSYVLYETLAEIQGTRRARLQLNEDWSWDLQRNRPLIEQAKMLFLPNPNSPSGNSWSLDCIQKLVPPNGVLVHDEAYGDFAANPHRMELLRSEVGNQVVVTKTLSKSYSLAGLRFGFCIAQPDLIRGMRKVKDSYNCDMIAMAAAEAALRDQDWMLANRNKILNTRTQLEAALTKLGFDVVPSDANFVWATHPVLKHQTIYEGLKARKVLIRFMQFPGGIEPCDRYPDGKLDGLRITVGTDEEIQSFLKTLRVVIDESAST
ncbi:histidinol-phosphate transaminase [Thalassoglobus sp. JC818]|uniref:histidinol-phosphate transaminase n=1 Tax=Thalassoglobus sp. JC818 TaxID=3232136 RepID=UPI00345AE522